MNLSEQVRSFLRGKEWVPLIDIVMEFSHAIPAPKASRCWIEFGGPREGRERRSLEPPETMVIRGRVLYLTRLIGYMVNDGFIGAKGRMVHGTREFRHLKDPPRSLKRLESEAKFEKELEETAKVERIKAMQEKSAKYAAKEVIRKANFQKRKMAKKRAKEESSG